MLSELFHNFRVSFHYFSYHFMIIQWIRCFISSSKPRQIGFLCCFSAALIAPTTLNFRFILFLSPALLLLLWWVFRIKNVYSVSFENKDVTGVMSLGLLPYWYYKCNKYWYFVGSMNTAVWRATFFETYEFSKILWIFIIEIFLCI